MLELVERQRLQVAGRFLLAVGQQRQRAGRFAAEVREQAPRVGRIDLRLARERRAHAFLGQQIVEEPLDRAIGGRVGEHVCAERERRRQRIRGG
ncbi:UNVERIFIED_ORG: hypothetical protein J2811_004240 [Burkholderia cepacia]|nr:hypothetical protein [Burkholderia cepacia]MDP9596612.1 hypothetical protein [Burkholderia cepacia]MDP9624784.1 hypothetical protein [Burkholderia cepacia]MDP9670869.1 hypothetical protein [Burkholderia cepacia]MDP9717878.1 hypothetical protein [Burkholderia cepacia]